MLPTASLSHPKTSQSITLCSTTPYDLTTKAVVFHKFPKNRAHFKCTKLNLNLIYTASQWCAEVYTHTSSAQNALKHTYIRIECIAALSIFLILEFSIFPSCRNATMHLACHSLWPLARGVAGKDEVEAVWLAFSDVAVGLFNNN